MYQHYAQYYDWEGTDAFCDFMAAHLITRLEALGIPQGANILDMACGTASTTIALAKAGYQVTGVDCSQPMLTIARQKINDASLEIDLYKGDMTTFESEESFDVVISTYDSVNHLPEEKLVPFFRRCKSLLESEGVMMFDINTLYNYQTHWQGKDRDETENARVLTESTFDEEKNVAKTDIVIQSHTDEGYTETEEGIEQFYYSDEQINQALVQAGFTTVDISDLPLPFLDSEQPLKRFVEVTC